MTRKAAKYSPLRLEDPLYDMLDECVEWHAKQDGGVKSWSRTALIREWIKREYALLFPEKRLRTETNDMYIQDDAKRKEASEVIDSYREKGFVIDETLAEYIAKNYDGIIVPREAD